MGVHCKQMMQKQPSLCKGDANHDAPRCVEKIEPFSRKIHCSVTLKVTLQRYIMIVSCHDEWTFHALIIGHAKEKT